MWRNVCHWAASSLDGCACALFVPSPSVKLRRAPASEKTDERLGTTKVQAISFLHTSPESDTSGLDLFLGSGRHIAVRNGCIQALARVRLKRCAMSALLDRRNQRG